MLSFVISSVLCSPLLGMVYAGQSRLVVGNLEGHSSSKAQVLTQTGLFALGPVGLTLPGAYTCICKTCCSSPGVLELLELLEPANLWGELPGSSPRVVDTRPGFSS